ncbi:hypothetical protein [Kitasatospora griseola]
MTDLAARLNSLFEPFLPEPPALYVLVRATDVSGVSGTGVVAEGVYFSPAAGSAAVTRWRGEQGSTVAWDRPGSVEEIHGHGGATRVVVLPVPRMAAALLSVANLAGQAGDDAWAHGWNEALHVVRGAIRQALGPYLCGPGSVGPEGRAE